MRKWKAVWLLVGTVYGRAGKGMFSVKSNKRSLVLAAGVCHLVSSQITTAQDILAQIETDPFLMYGDEEMISIATGTVKPLHLAPSVATVITAKDIKAMGARNLDDVLEYVPGLHVSPTDTRLDAIYSIRGIQTKLTPQVLFLINGVNLDNPVNGARLPLFRLGIANISRIEIIRGPGSALHGADAFSGVINVITKDADELAGTTVGGRSGSFNSQDAWIQHGGKYSGWDAAISVEYSESDGDDGRIVDADTQTLFDVLYNTPSISPLPAVNSSGLSDLPRASLAPGPVNTQYTQFDTSITLENDKWILWLNSWNLRDGGQGVGAAQALDPVGRQRADLYTIAINYRDDELTEYLELDVKTSYNYMDQQATFQLLPPGARVLLATDGNLQGVKNPNPDAGFVIFSDGLHGNPGGEGDMFFLETALAYTRLHEHKVRVSLGFNTVDIAGKSSKNFGPGVIDTSLLSMTADTYIDGSLTNVTGTPSSFMDDQKRHVHFVTLQDEWHFASDWELTAGVRYDDFSDFGGTTNPRLALVWAADYNLTTKLLYGRAFRAPALNELYFKNNPSVLGNPNVEPETIDMLELVFDYRPSFDVDTVTNLFRYQIEDLIDFSTGRAENEKDQDGYGLEFYIRWKIANNTTILANYAWQKSKDSNTGAVVANVPTRQASLAIRYKLQHSCSLSPQINWVADRRRAFNDARAPIEDYTIADFTARCDSVANMPLSLAASVHNLTDTDAREPGPVAVPNDFPLEGRSVYLELSYKFDSK